MRISGAIDRLRRVEPRAADWLIALTLAAALQIELALVDRVEGSALGVVAALLLTLPLAWRRRSPLALALIFLATTVVGEVLGAGIFHAAPPLFLALIAGAVVFYSLGAYADDRAARLGVVIGVIGIWTSVIASGEIDAQSFVFSAGVVVVAPWLAGRVSRARKLRVADLEREQEQRARLAVGDERQRIAREVHDVIAHSVGVMVVQADGARRILERDPDRAREALRSIADTGRTALSELQRSLGVLREGDAGATLAPQPGMDDVGTLVEQARDAGLTVAVSVEGERTPLSQGIDLAGYRIVQEALTNVIKHAGTVDAWVTIRYGRRALEVEVADDGAGPSANGSREGTGHGLVGMRERVALYGGELQAGPGREGGFVVRASIPTAT